MDQANVTLESSNTKSSKKPGHSVSSYDLQYKLFKQNKIQRLDCVTIFAAPNNNVAFNKVLEVELKEALVKYPRPDLYLKFAYF